MTSTAALPEQILVAEQVTRAAADFAPDLRNKAIRSALDCVASSSTALEGAEAKVAELEGARSAAVEADRRALAKSLRGGQPTVEDRAVRELEDRIAAAIREREARTLGLQDARAELASAVAKSSPAIREQVEAVATRLKAELAAMIRTAFGPPSATMYEPPWMVEAKRAQRAAYDRIEELKAQLGELNLLGSDLQALGVIEAEQVREPKPEAPARVDKFADLPPPVTILRPYTDRVLAERPGTGTGPAPWVEPIAQPGGFAKPETQTVSREVAEAIQAEAAEG